VRCVVRGRQGQTHFPPRLSPLRSPRLSPRSPPGHELTRPAMDLLVNVSNQLGVSVRTPSSHFLPSRAHPPHPAGPTQARPPPVPLRAALPRVPLSPLLDDVRPPSPLLCTSLGRLPLDSSSPAFRLLPAPRELSPHVGDCQAGDSEQGGKGDAVEGVCGRYGSPHHQVRELSCYFSPPDSRSRSRGCCRAMGWSLGVLRDGSSLTGGLGSSSPVASIRGFSNKHFSTPGDPH
jgi:hypothetical protein